MAYTLCCELSRAPARAVGASAAVARTMEELIRSETAMQGSADTSKEPKPRPRREFDDPHFHDDEDRVPADDVEHWGTPPPARRKTVRRPLPRRRYDED